MTIFALKSTTFRNNMKTIISFLALALISLQTNAQTMKDLISSMPDSITPLLTKNNRLNLIDYLEAGQKAVEKNRLGGDSELTHLTDTRAVFKMTASSSMDIKLLKDPEPTIGVITGVNDGKNSTIVGIIKYYTLDWKLINTIKPEAFVGLSWKDENDSIKSTIYNPLELKNDEFKK